MIDKDVYKKNFYNFVQNTISLLEEIKSLSEIKKEVFLNSTIQNIFLTTDKKIKELNYVVDNIEWDSLNIAFLGETNVGKSTLIEALNKGDGSSIGEGYKDYTKELTIIQFNKKINLLDMPGIEGKEKALDEIKKGLLKSHIIFFVIGNNKEPEEGTINKIKEYIEDKPKFYIILNVRGKPTRYKFDKTPLTENEDNQKIIKRTIGKLEDIFIEDTFILNAYLAFLSVGKPKRKEFREDKRKVTEVFREKKLSFIEKIKNFLIGPSKKILEKVYLYSNLKNLEELLQELSANNDKDIFISNTYKFLNLVENIIFQLGDKNKELTEQIKVIEERNLKAFRKIEGVVEKYLKEIKKNVEIEIDNLEVKIRECIYTGIEEEEEKEKIEEKINDIIKYKKKQINGKIRELIKDMEKEIRNIFLEWKERIKLEFDVSGFELKNISKIIDPNIFKTILMNLKAVVNIFLPAFIGGKIGWKIGWIFGPKGALIGGLIGTLIGGIAGLVKFVFFDIEEEKRKKKQKAYLIIKENFDKIREIFLQEYKEKYKEILEKIKIQIKDINSLLKDVKDFSFLIHDKIEELNGIKNEAATYLCKYLFSDKIEKVIISLNMNHCIIICDYQLPNNLEKTLRLKQVKCYNSEEFLKAEGIWEVE